MHRFQNYADLRLNTRGQNADISLWPSFTDIMTVILMIFMLTMIVVIIKNANLAQQLIIRENRQKQIEEALEESRKTESELKLGITNLEEKLRDKEMEIILLGDEAKAMQRSLEAKLATISASEKEISELREDVRRLATEVSHKESEAAELEVRYEKKLSALTEETKRLIEEFNRKFAALAEHLSQKEETILTLDAEKTELELALAKQRKAYSVLEDKYQKLIGPARSPLGKKVVAVHYSKKDGEYQILFKDLDAAEFQKLDEEHLHDRLAKLKKQLENKLYVKIIIPETSGLSYNEAWDFTRDILSRYDYYYQ
jgi:chromosome segregation ATPase